MSAHVDSNTIESTKPVDNPVDSTVIVSQLIQPYNQPQVNQPKSICQPMLIQPQLNQPDQLITQLIQPQLFRS